MRYRWLYGIVVLLLCGTTGYLLVQRGHYQALYTQLVALNQEQTGEEQILTEVAQNREIELALNGQRLQGVKVRDLNGEEIGLASIIDHDQLCLLFSSTHCQACIQTEMLNLSDSPLNESRDVLILILTSDRRYAQIVAQTNEAHDRVYMVAETDSSIPAVSLLNAPCYFVIEKGSFRINSAYVSQKNTPELSQSYLKRVSEKFDFGH